MFAAPDTYGDSLPGRVCRLLMPWTVDTYPGATRYLSALCGVGRRTPEVWLYRGRPLPFRHVPRLLAVVRAHRIEAERLEAELVAYAIEAEARTTRPVGFVKRRSSGGKTG